MNEQPPSQDALKLAKVIQRRFHRTVMHGVRLAATIDDELQLPQRNAALLCAQGVADLAAKEDFDTEDLLDEIAHMREALCLIKSKIA